MEQAKERQVPYIFIIAWSLFWIIVFGIYDGLLKPNGFNYTNSSFVVFTHYFGFALVGAIIFRTYSEIPQEIRRIKSLLLALAIIAFFIVITTLINHYFPISAERHQHFQTIQVLFPNFDPQTSFAKSGDIFFQQLMILTIVSKLRNLGLNNNSVIWCFSVAFFLVHLPLFFFTGYSSLYFIIPSMFAGFIFSWLILNLRLGFLYSEVVHLSFCLILGLIMRYLDFA